MDATQLRNVLVRYFDENELRTLCVDLDVDYESLPGIGKLSKARELISYMQRRDRLAELVDAITKQRPTLTLQGDQPARSLAEETPMERARATSSKVEASDTPDLQRARDFTHPHRTPPLSRFAVQWSAMALLGGVMLLVFGELLAMQIWGGIMTDLGSFDGFVFQKVPWLPVLGGILLGSAQWFLLRSWDVRLALWVGGNIVIWGILSFIAQDVALPFLCNVLLGPILVWERLTRT